MLNQQLILLLRHAKALKNLEIRYGGMESPLLPEGYADLEAVVSEINKQKIAVEQIITAPHLQCKQTAHYLSTALKLPYAVNPDLMPAQIGLISGLTIAEVKEKYPEIAAQLDKWRAGQCEIHELNIPGMVAPEEYYENMKAVSEKIMSSERSILLVGSLSILIAIANFLLDRPPQPGGNYRAFLWDNSGAMCFYRQANTYIFISAWSTVKPSLDKP